MSGQGIQQNQYRKILGWFLIVFGSLLMAIGSTVYLSNARSELEEVASEVSTEMATSDVSTEMAISEVVSEAVLEESTIKPVPAKFSGESATVKAVTVLMADGTMAKSADVPAFHLISSISAELGINPKTNAASDTLRLVMSKAPDREMTVSVLVSTENPVVAGQSPDAIEGMQWILTYAGGQFKKMARMVAEDGSIAEQSTDSFNIRFDGNDGMPLIDFFGPPETIYYAVMIYDGTYFTLIKPE